jgi:hypothetical protein
MLTGQPPNAHCAIIAATDDVRAQCILAKALLIRGRLSPCAHRLMNVLAAELKKHSSTIYTHLDMIVQKHTPALHLACASTHVQPSKPTQRTAAVWPRSRCTHSPVCTRHTRTVLSLLAVTNLYTVDARVINMLTYDREQPRSPLQWCVRAAQVHVRHTFSFGLPPFIKPGLATSRN